MKASDLLVKALESEGVERVFGVPGEENLDLLDSLSRSSIELVLTRHEQAAGFMAATQGRLTGRAGVCLATLGPGATNLVTAAAYAQLGAMPLLMITGQKPIKSSKQGEFQIIDVVDMMTPLTKYTRQLVSGQAIPARVREAFRRAELERPGAVHLELPEDVAQESTEAPIIAPSRAEMPQASDECLALAAQAIRSARRPLLLIGASASRYDIHASLKALVDRTGIPWVATQMGKGVLDERHPGYLGTAALSSDDFVHRAFEAADLIINIGHDVIEKPPFVMGADTDAANCRLGAGEFLAPCGDAQVIHLNYVPASVDSVYYPQQEVIGDMADSISRLADRLSVEPHWDFAVYQRVRQGFTEQLTAHAQDARIPMDPQRLVAEVRALMPDDGILALDNGIYKLWFARNYPAYQSNTLLLDNALASMGAGLPSAMATKLVHPERRVVAVCGDGGFMMNSQEMETAVRLKLDLVVLVLRDDAYGMIRWKQRHMGFSDYGLNYGNPDFIRYAQSYGATGVEVTSIPHLVDSVQSAWHQGGVHLIVVPVNYEENEPLLNHQIPAMSRALAL
ncbi:MULTISPECIES: acetolactate synthase large subunit [unclassified Marinimicrobium]|uniref:acetolactate synthase large subunit n=1 Tax=unclassified Marinimicrobium TaxID=2632100 RepID=UPI000C40E554|nr:MULTISPECIES: acetolactate synthase large subunit [unclassified Marinimicrobium]MAN53229.1 acetolactate synthase large subunit [Marinimicrobium sp.]